MHPGMQSAFPCQRIPSCCPAVPGLQSTGQPEPRLATNSKLSCVHAHHGPTLCVQVLEGATALALSASLCYAGSRIAAYLSIPGALIPAATGAACIVQAASLPCMLDLA